MIRSAQEIIDAARRLSRERGRFRVSVAAAEDADVLAAVRSACDEGICDASLFGDTTKMQNLAGKSGISLDNLQLIHQSDPSAAVMAAVALAAGGGADVIMKGFVSTSALLKGVLDHQFDLRAAPTLSHVAVLTIPGHPKLLMITDGGMVVKPTIEQRLDIIRNAVLVGRALGIDPVRVALSAATEKVVASMPQTMDSARIVEELEKNPLEGCTAAGPLCLDAAISAEIAAAAGIDNPVAGNADAYVVGSIEECNITTKSMIIFAGAIFAGVIMGARVPVSLVSRTDPMIGKKTSIALACLISHFYRTLPEGRKR
jgi:phosphate butyryltransferase